MKERHLKLIMELIFIFIIPLILICGTSTIEKTYVYDNSGNYQTSETELSFDNSIINYTNGYKNTINDFNLLQSYTYGYYYLINDVLYDSLGNGTATISNDIGVNVSNGDLLYFYYDGPTALYIKVWIVDNSNNKLDYQVKDGNETITISNNGILYFTIEYGYNISINDIKICINKSVSWADGNYVPYGEPLILYTQTDVSGQNDINYTVWGKIKQLLIVNLDLNDSILLDLIICYTIIWFIMFIIWHMLYLFFDMLIHIGVDWGHREREKVSK